jgi:hypothetical protein
VPAAWPAAIPVQRDHFSVTVEAGREISGKITDKDTGRPLADIRVQPSAEVPGRSTAMRVAHRAVTDRSGRYRLGGVPVDVNYLRAEPAGREAYFPLAHRLPVSRPRKGRAPDPAPDLEIDLQLTRGEWLTGRVVEARANQPVGGFRVRYVPHQDNMSPAAFVGTGKPSPKVDGPERFPRRELGMTESDGGFRIVAPPGRGWVLVGHDRSAPYFSARDRDVQGEAADRTVLAGQTPGIDSADLLMNFALAAVTVDPDRDATFTITVEPGVFPEIRFVDPEGKPLRDVLTHDYRVGRSEPLPETVRLRSKVNPDRPEAITVFHPERKLGIGYRPKVGDAGPWTVQLQPLATVTARLVRANGEPIANEPVYVNPRSGHGIPLSPRNWKFTTDKEGRVRFTDIIGDAEYSLWCADLAFEIRDPRSRPFSARPGETKDLGTIKATPPSK